MVNRYRTPTDKLTGLPLPILDLEPRENGALFLSTDYHHHFHPRLSPELDLDAIGGKALRYSRGQMVDRTLHQNYHDTYLGPRLPKTDQEHFTAVVLAVCGIVPRKALDVSIPGVKKIVNLTDAQHRQIASTDNIYVHNSKDSLSRFYKFQKIGEYLGNYALMHSSYDVIDPVSIEEFIDKRVLDDRKRQLGTIMLASALDSTIESVRQIIPELAEAGYLMQHRQAEPLRDFSILVKRTNSLARIDKVLKDKLEVA